MMMPFVQGFATGGGLIVAIGAQNAFVLSQGVQGNRPLVVALICFICDAAMILVGCLGAGALVLKSQTIHHIAVWGGILFLVAYGARSFRSALRGGQLDANQRAIRSLWTLVGTTLAVTLLNPHVYLDTVVLLGTISSQFGDLRPVFAAGAICASFVWFFSLSYGARLLAPLFKRVWAWRVLDGAVALTMWGIASSLIHTATTG